MMILYIGLMIVTVLYVMLSAVMDVKERQIYTFPAMVLSFTWIMYMLCTGKYQNEYLVIYVMFNCILWFVFNTIKMWGAGDSDMFLVASNVLLAVTGPMQTYKLMIMECLIIIGVVITAMIVGVVECVIKKKKITLHSKIAVVPGFAVVIIVLMFIGLFGRVWL